MVCELLGGLELTWIVFQVGQQPRAGPGQPQELAQGCGSQTTSQATGTHSASLHTRESVQIVYRQALMSDGVFQGQVGNLEA